MHRTYELICQLAPDVALKRIESLLSEEGVKYASTKTSITTTSAPIVLFGIQPKLYSQKNWVGLNPFPFVSGVELKIIQEETGLVKVTVRVNQGRGLLWVAFWTTCALLAASAMPEPGAAILLVGVTTSAWLLIVSFFGGHLIKKELAGSLDVLL